MTGHESLTKRPFGQESRRGSPLRRVVVDSLGSADAANSEGASLVWTRNMGVYFERFARLQADSRAQRGSPAALFGKYALGLVPGLLLSGPVSDRYGRRAIVFPAAALTLAASRLLGVGGGSFWWWALRFAASMSGPPVLRSRSR